MSDWDDERGTIGIGPYVYLVVCRFSALDGVSLPFFVRGTHSSDENDDSTNLEKVVIEVTDGSSTIEITYDASDEDSPLKDGSSILSSQTAETSFTLNNGEYTVSLSQDKFEMQFNFQDEDSNNIDGKFNIKFIGNDGSSYDNIVIETTDALSGYLCGVCGNL